MILTIENLLPVNNVRTPSRTEIDKIGCFLLWTDFQYRSTKTENAKIEKIKSVVEIYFD